MLKPRKPIFVIAALLILIVMTCMFMTSCNKKGNVSSDESGFITSSTYSTYSSGGGVVQSVISGINSSVSSITSSVRSSTSSMIGTSSISSLTTSSK